MKQGGNMNVINDLISKEKIMKCQLLLMNSFQTEEVYINQLHSYCD